MLPRAKSVFMAQVPSSRKHTIRARACSISAEEDVFDLGLGAGGPVQSLFMAQVGLHYVLLLQL